jgi:hypothetical protein
MVLGATGIGTKVDFVAAVVAAVIDDVRSSMQTIRARVCSHGILTLLRECFPTGCCLL